MIELLGPIQSLAREEAEQVAAAAPLLQATRLVTGGSAWNEQDDEGLLAQGRASAGAAADEFDLAWRRRSPVRS